MTTASSLRDPTDPSPADRGAKTVRPVSWRRQLGLAPEHTCEMRIEHHMVHESLDGRVFRVRWLVCDGCGHRRRDVKQQETTPVLPKLYRGGAVAAVEADS